jgi:hypothetical protein
VALTLPKTLPNNRHEHLYLKIKMHFSTFIFYFLGAYRIFYLNFVVLVLVVVVVRIAIYI